VAWTGLPPATLVGVPVTFDGTWVRANQWRIDYGDGTSTSGSGSLTVVRTHTYHDAGRYTARLTVRGAGGEDAATVGICVGLFC
jgi:PKD repeat protein